jgi:hypothetical protein
VTRNKAIFLLVSLALVVGAIGGYWLLPKHYASREHLSEADIFWNDGEAFFFLNTNTTVRCSNFLVDRLNRSKHGYLGALLGAGGQFYEHRVKAYRLSPSGELRAETLPEQATTRGSWSLQDGKLQVVPTISPYVQTTGFTWDGERFVAVPAQPRTQVHPQGGTGTTLKADDADEEEEDEPGLLSPAARKRFKDAGWHYKQLTGFLPQDSQGTLPMQLGKEAFEVTITKFPPPTAQTFNFDMTEFGVKTLQLGRTGEPQTVQALWAQSGWQALTKNEYELRVARSGRVARNNFLPLVWLAIFLLAMFWKFGTWGHLLFGFLGLKRRMLKNMATSYSFPPATPAQFPELDLAGLHRYTQELESMGFVRLLDFSLVSNGALAIPSFARLFVHTRHHCFAETSQIFPPRKKPRELACSFQSVLQDGWTLGFSDRKPNASSAMLRRRKALGVNMPGASTAELLQGFLQMREQVCQDLGISPVKDDTLEAYIAKVQRTATDMREAVKEKNIAAGVSHMYYRKFALLKAREEYTWLGDYPKEAERRKFGQPVRA